MSCFRKAIDLSGEFRPSTIFLGEGQSEVLFLDAALKQLKVGNSSCCVFDLNGLDNLDTRVRLISEQPNFSAVERLAVMVDADQDPIARLHSVRESIRKIGFPSSDSDRGADRIFRDGSKKTLIIITPGEAESGRIERLVLREIAKSPVGQLIEQFCSDADRILPAPISDKGRVQIYISAHKGSLCGLGRAFQAGILKINAQPYAETLDLIRAFLQ